MNKWGIRLFSLNLLSCISLLLGACSFNKPQIDYYAPGTEAIVSELSYVNHTWYCEPLQVPESPALQFPTDIAVTQDGQTVYAINGECLGYTFSPDQSFGIRKETGCKTQPYSNEVELSQAYRSPDLRRRFVYELKLNRPQPEIFKVNGKPPLSCVLGNDLETDSHDRLYAVDEVNQRIYRLGTKLEKVLEIDEESTGGINGLSPISRKNHFETPKALHATSTHLYYSTLGRATVQSEGQIRSFDFANQDSKVLYTYKAEASSAEFRFLSVVGKTVFIWFLPFRTQSPDVEAPLQEITLDQIHKTTNSFGRISDTIATETQGQWIFYATDVAKHVVYKLITTPAFEFSDFSVFAGAPEQAGYQDGAGPAAHFDSPTALSLDRSGNLYVADTGNHAIRKITPDGVVSTFYKESQLLTNTE